MSFGVWAYVVKLAGGHLRQGQIVAKSYTEASHGIASKFWDQPYRLDALGPAGSQVFGRLN